MLVISMLLISVLSFNFFTSEASGSTEYEKWGPRVDYLQFIIYSNYESEVQALRNGLVDFIDWPLDYDTYNLLKTDPDFVLEPLTMYDCYDIDINNLRWPTSDYQFRKAIAHLINYEDFYTLVLRAYAGEMMDNIIWSEWAKWYNPDATKYWYDPYTALDILAAAGYENWDGDPQLEWKAPNATIYELPSLEFYARQDDPIRNALGDMINADLNAIGIPTTYVVAQRSICWQKAYQKYEYHLYTAGMGPFPDPQFLYDYYHSKYATPEIAWCMNNVFFMNATYDYWVEAMKFAPDEATAINACKEAQAVFMDQVPLIPVYYSAGSKAYRANYGHHGGEEPYWDRPWNGFVNSIIPTIDSGINDYWTCLNAHPGDVTRGGVLRYGWMSDADHINPITVYSIWDSYLQDELYSTLLMLDPFTGFFIPWLAKEWTIETWDYGGDNATKLTLELYDNLKWSDGQPLNSSDVAFTMKYMYDANSPSYYPYVETIDGIDTLTPHIETPDANTVVIYYTVQSVWALSWAGDTPIIPKHIWEAIAPRQVENKGEFVTTGNLTCSGPYVIDSYLRGQYWLLRANPYFFRYGPPHDIATRDVAKQKTIVGRGNNARINITVENIGYFTETATIELFANASSIATIPGVTVTNGTSTTTTYTWDTEGVAYGNYSLRAYAWPVIGEIETADNTLTNGWIYVGITGDVDGNDFVEVKDLLAIALAYGSSPGDPKFGPNLDINDDDFIDVKDILAAALNYGQTIPP